MFVFVTGHHEAMATRSSQHAVLTTIAAIAALLLGATAGWMHAAPQPMDIGEAGSVTEATAEPTPALNWPAPSAATTQAPAWQEAQLPPRDSPDRFLQLQELAADDNAYAAYEVAVLLRRCAYNRDLSDEAIDTVASSSAALAVEQVEAQRAVLEQELGTTLAAPEPDGVAIAESQVETLRELRRTCQGVEPPEHHDDWLHALERAALLGHPGAQLEYGSTALLRESDVGETARRKPLVRQFLAAALQRGEPDALRAWATMLGQGYLAEPDQPLGYAYLLAWSRHPSHPLHERMLGAMAMNAVAGDLLSPAEIRQAEALSREILARCCKG